MPTAVPAALRAEQLQAERLCTTGRPLAGLIRPLLRPPLRVLCSVEL